MSRHCSSVKSVGYDLSFIAPLPQNLTPTRRVNNSPDQMSRDNNCLKFSKPCNGHALKGLVKNWWASDTSLKDNAMEASDATNSFVRNHAGVSDQVPRGPAGVEDLDQSMLLATPPVAVEGVVLGAEPGQCFMQGGLVLLHLDQQAIAGLGGPREAVLLTMQGIGGEQHAGQAQVLHQRRHGRDLAGRPGHLLVGQDEGGVTGKGAEHMSCGPVVQVIEAAAQRLAIKCDGALPSHLDRPVQLVRMAAEGSLEIVPLEQTAQRVHRRCPAQAGAEGGVQAVALNGDEGDDLLVGGRPCENREQQQMAQAIALSLRAAWIMDSFKRGKQRTKRHQGDLHQLRTSLQQIRYRTLRALPLGRVGSGRRGRTA